MRTFLVYWEMDIEAETPVEAARKALAIHRDPDSIATVFEVRGPRSSVQVDLTEGTTVEVE